MHSPASALALADDLARLIDDMTTRQVRWSRLDTLVPDHLDKYWQLTLDFLKIAREAWPAILEERGAIEPAARRDLLIEAERTRLAAHHGPVIAAGSTGSMPATAKLLATIATLPHGAVVLPGLDTELDDGRLEPDRRHAGRRSAGVRPSAACDARAAAAHRHRARRGGPARRRLGARPCASPRRCGRRPRPSAGPSGSMPRRATRRSQSVSVIEAANAEEEALAIAVALREAVHEKQDRRAGDAGPRAGAPGRRRARTLEHPGGRFRRRRACPTPKPACSRGSPPRPRSEDLPPVKLLALLKHARFRLGAAAGAHARAIAALELAILRGPRPRPGVTGLATRWRRSAPRRCILPIRAATLKPIDLEAAQALVVALGAALAPLEVTCVRRHSARSPRGMRRRCRRCRATMPETRWRSPAPTARSSRARSRTSSSSRDDFPVAPADYADLFETAIADRACRRAETPGAHVRIFGPLEARLVSVDRVVLGALVEGVWPPETRSDPWLSRPMRLELGLDLPGAARRPVGARLRAIARDCPR